MRKNGSWTIKKHNFGLYTNNIRSHKFPETGKLRDIVFKRRFNYIFTKYQQEDDTSDQTEMLLVFSGCHLFAMTSAIVNPIVYGFLNENFKKVNSAFKLWAIKLNEVENIYLLYSIGSLKFMSIPPYLWKRQNDAESEHLAH